MWKFVLKWLYQAFPKCFLQLAFKKSCKTVIIRWSEFSFLNLCLSLQIAHKKKKKSVIISSEKDFLSRITYRIFANLSAPRNSFDVVPSFRMTDFTTLIQKCASCLSSFSSCCSSYLLFSGIAVQPPEDNDFIVLLLWAFSLVFCRVSSTTNVLMGHT